MNPWTILAWTAALAASAIILTLALAAVVGMIRSLKLGKTLQRQLKSSERTHGIYQGDDHHA